MKRLKLVLSCYACEPNRGSEPGVGWTWALGMAKRHDTSVLTRANNREVIEKELSRLSLPESETPKFIYVDLSPTLMKLKKKGILPVSLYYLLWQFKARNTLDSLNLNADIIHHVTFNSFVCPGVWWRRKEKIVLGPLGGMSVCSKEFLRLYGPFRRSIEFLRGLTRRMWRLNIFYILARNHADALVFTEQSVADRVGKAHEDSCVLLETAMPIALEQRLYDEIPRKENQMVWAGTLEPHKAFEIALCAYAEVFTTVAERPVLKVFGEGSQRHKYERMVADFNLCGHIVFCGNVSQNQLWSEIRRSKALIFSSVRDTSGNVAIESLALQTPVVCFNHQGVGAVTDDSCAFRVEPSNWQNAVSGFSVAMKRLNNDPELVQSMGANGRRRVLDQFTWSRKFDFFEALYNEVTSRA